MASNYFRGVRLFGHREDLADRLTHQRHIGSGRQDAVGHQVLPRPVEERELRARGVVDRLDRLPGQLGTDAAVDEEHAVQHHRHRPLSQPVTVATTRTQSVHVLDPTQGVLDFPCVLGDLVGGLADQVPVLLDRQPQLALPFFRLGGGKGGENLRVGVAEEAEEIHGFVVAEDHLHPAAGLGGLGLESHDQVEHLPDLEPAVEEIAELDIGRIAAGPLQVLVEDAGLLQDRGQPFEVPMNIAHRHDAARVGRRHRQRHRQRENHNEMSTPDHHPLLQSD